MRQLEPEPKPEHQLLHEHTHEPKPLEHQSTHCYHLYRFRPTIRTARARRPMRPLWAFVTWSMPQQ